MFVFRLFGYFCLPFCNRSCLLLSSMREAWMDIGKLRSDAFPQDKVQLEVRV